ncbi:MAG: hypothetical protein PUC82_00485 [bacterium]|nr:hypothetical protein [bacterium]
MRNICLTEEEITGINLFVNNAIDDNNTLGIYLLPYLSKFCQERLTVVWVFDSINTKEKDINFIKDIAKYNQLFKEKRLRFSYQDFTEELSHFNHERYFFMQKALASGVILYDKIGVIEEKKDSLEKHLGAFANALEVSNIDSIVINDKQALEYVKI